MSYQGVIDPVPPSVDQCIQVLVDPAQDTINIQQNTLPDQAWLLPRNVITMTGGTVWKQRSGIKRGRDHSPVLPVTGHADPSFLNTDWDQVRFAGVSMDGIHDAKNAKSNPNAAARTSVQMHGVATIFCPTAPATAKFGDPVWAICPQQATVIDPKYANMSIIGVHDGFTPFLVQVRPLANIQNDGKTDYCKFIGWFVDGGPSDRNEIRVHLDPHYASIAQVDTGSFTFSTFADGGGAMETDGNSAAAPTVASMVSSSFSSASAPGVAIAALSAAAEIAGHPLPFGAALVGPNVGDSSEFQTLSRVAEEQEPHGMAMSLERQHALYGTNGPIDEVTKNTAATLDAFYSGSALPELPSAVTTVRGALTDVGAIPREHIDAGTTAAGAAPHYLLRQTSLANGAPLTQSACGVIPDALRGPSWQQKIDGVLQKYEHSGPVSTMSAMDARAMAADVRAALII